MLSKRKVFEKVKKHLLAQNKQSRALADGSSSYLQCAYRGDNGEKCAVGCLISDKAYDASLEGFGIKNTVIFALQQSGVGKSCIPMLRDLQLMHDTFSHDTFSPETWAQKIDAIEQIHLKTQES